MTERVFTLVNPKGMFFQSLDYRSAEEFREGFAPSRGKLPGGTFTIECFSSALLHVVASSVDEAMANAPRGVPWLVFDADGKCCTGDDLGNTDRSRLLAGGESP